MAPTPGQKFYIIWPSITILKACAKGQIRTKHFFLLLKKLLILLSDAVAWLAEYIRENLQDVCRREEIKIAKVDGFIIVE